MHWEDRYFQIVRRIFIKFIDCKREMFMIFYTHETFIVELSICIYNWLQICINFAENTHIFLIIVKKKIENQLFCRI